MNALELRGVTAGYGKIQVLHGVDLVLPPSTVLALLGPNGAGKSTTLKVITGRVAPTGGCVHVAGNHINGARPAAVAAAGVCAIPEGRGVFPNLTVQENLRVMTYRGVDLERVVEIAFHRFPRLRDRRTQLAGTLSGGEQQMLAMARALTSEPRLLLLDEISMGLAPKVVAELYDVVAQLAQTGVSILLVEQFARTALKVADLAAVMVHGTVRAFGEPVDIRDDVAEAYLGGAA